MNYPVVIHKDKHSDYGVTVPDLPGCFSAGKSLDEALAMVREAIELHLEGLIEDAQPIPEPGTVDDHQAKAEYRGGVWAVVTIDPSTLRTRAQRINITVPERVLDAIDRHAHETGQTRSGFLVQAAVSLMGRERGEQLKPAKLGRPQKRETIVKPSRKKRK